MQVRPSFTPAKLNADSNIGSNLMYCSFSLQTSNDQAEIYFGLELFAEVTKQLK